MSDGVQIRVLSVIVERVSDLYSPRETLEAFEVPAMRQWMSTTKPLSTYGYSRGPQYHKRRIRYFVDRLRKGFELDPIELQSELVYEGEVPLVILDGHHRFLAYHYLKRERMPALYAGSRELLRYLVGDRDRVP